MRSKIIFASSLFPLLLLFGFFPAPCVAQALPMARLTPKIARSIKRKEPEWRYIMGFCTCPPLLPSQVNDDLAVWNRKRANGTRERVGLQIYTIGSRSEAVDFMKNFASGRYRGHSRIYEYQLGDEAFLLDYSDVKTGPNVTLKNPLSLWIRQGNFVLNIYGELPGTVLRFARYALTNLPVN
jgi:hypothetical protein